MTEAACETTTPAEGERSGPVTMVEALERWLPYCAGKPVKVAARLDTLYREGDVLLLGGDVAIPSGSNPSMLGIVAHTPPAGLPFLYVQMRTGRPPGPVWDVGMTLEDLDKHHRFWTFERESFEAHFPGTPRNRGGRPRVFSRERALIEAAVSVYEDGLPEPFTLEAFAARVAARLGDNSPSPTWLKDVLKPLHQRLKASAAR